MAVLNDEKKNKTTVEDTVQTNENLNNSNRPLGVDDDTYNKMNSQFTQSDASKQADADVKEGRDYISKVVSEPIISDKTMNRLDDKFKTPTAVKQADSWISSQLQTIQSGKTSFSDQLQSMMDTIMNREKFSYDVDSDPLFQQALASAMSSGKQAMQDTMGQASALTGGYGSTYATTAGNQAYNSFIEDAYDNLPQYYQMAMEAYQMEGDELYRQYGMLYDADATEYQRNVTAFDATSQYRNQLWNESYTMFRDEKNDAFATANLELNEHGQKVNDANVYYNAASGYADTTYNREYNAWSDTVNQAFQTGQMLNSDYWNQSNQDFTAGQNQLDRDFTASENQLNREHETSENQTQRDWQTTENQKDRDFTSSENAKNRAASKSSGGSGGSGGSGYKLTNSEYDKVNEIFSATKGSNRDKMDAVQSYLRSIGKEPQSEEEGNLIADAIGYDGEEENQWWDLFDWF